MEHSRSKPGTRPRTAASRNPLSYLRSVAGGRDQLRPPLCAREGSTAVRRGSTVRVRHRQLVTPGPHLLRGRLRQARRRRTPPDLQRPDHASPTQPRRRPPTQPSTAHDRAPPPPTPPSNTPLHRPPHQRRQKHPRRDPDPQALPRPPPLPRHAEREPRDDLTVIGASFRNSQCHRGSTVASGTS